MVGTPPILQIRDLHVETEGIEILKGLDIDFEKGKAYAILGPNASGKSNFESDIDLFVISDNPPGDAEISVIDSIQVQIQWRTPKAFGRIIRKIKTTTMLRTRKILFDPRGILVKAGQERDSKFSRSSPIDKEELKIIRLYLTYIFNDLKKIEDFPELFRAKKILHDLCRIKQLNGHHLVNDRHNPLVDRPHPAPAETTDNLISTYLLHGILTSVAWH